MEREAPFRPRLRERIGSVWEATTLVVRALLHHRMGSLLPLLVVLLLMSYVGMVLGVFSPVALLPRSAQVVPFVYPLF